MYSFSLTISELQITSAQMVCSGELSALYKFFFPLERVWMIPLR